MQGRLKKGGCGPNRPQNESMSVFYPSSAVGLLLRLYDELEKAGKIGKRFKDPNYKKGDRYVTIPYPFHMKAAPFMLVLKLRRVGDRVEAFGLEILETANCGYVFPATVEQAGASNNIPLVAFCSAPDKMCPSFAPKMNESKKDDRSLVEKTLSLMDFISQHPSATQEMKMIAQFRKEHMGALKTCLEALGAGFEQTDKGRWFLSAEASAEALGLRKDILLKDITITYDLYNAGGTHKEFFLDNESSAAWPDICRTYAEQNFESGFCFMGGGIAPVAPLSRKMMGRAKLSGITNYYRSLCDASRYGYPPAESIPDRDKRTEMVRKTQFQCSVENNEKIAVAFEYIKQLCQVYYLDFEQGKRYVYLFTLDGNTIAGPDAIQQGAINDVRDGFFSEELPVTQEEIGAGLEQAASDVRAAIRKRLDGYHAKYDSSVPMYYMEVTMFGDNSMSITSYGLWNESRYEKRLKAWFEIGRVPCFFTDGDFGYSLSRRSSGRINYFLGSPAISNLITYGSTYVGRYKEPSKRLRQLLYSYMLLGHGHSQTMGDEGKQAVSFRDIPPEVFDYVLEQAVTYQLETSKAALSDTRYLHAIFTAASLLMKQNDQEVLFMNFEKYFEAVRDDSLTKGQIFQTIRDMRDDVDRDTDQRINSGSMTPEQIRSFLFGRLFGLALGVENEYRSRNKDKASNVAAYRTAMMGYNPGGAWNRLQESMVSFRLNSISKESKHNYTKRVSHLIAMMDDGIAAADRVIPQYFILGEAVQISENMLLCDMLINASKKPDEGADDQDSET